MKLQNRLPALSILHRPELQFFLLWKKCKRPFALFQWEAYLLVCPTITSLAGGSQTVVPVSLCRPPTSLLEDCYRCITTVCKPAALCIPTVQCVPSYPTLRGLLFSVFCGEIRPSSKSFILRNITKWFFPADQILLAFPGPWFRRLLLKSSCTISSAQTSSWDFSQSF